MKLLFDENLSRKLVGKLSELYPESKHVADLDLLQVSDLTIWNAAKNAEFTIVTTDADFFELASEYGPPPKVIWLRRWTHPTRDAETLLRSQAIRITQFAADEVAAVLVLEKS